METKMLEIDNKLSTGNCNEKMNVSEIVGEVLTEQVEREKRKLSIVCFGLKESKAGNDRDQTDRVNEDKDGLGKIIDNVMNLSGIQISNPIRLGRYEANGAKIRPVKFTVSSMDDKRMILDRACTNVRNSSLEMCKGLFFNSDLTPAQRREDYLRRMERRKHLDGSNGQQRHGGRAAVREGATGSARDFR